jgi:putative PIG3 family NAD(P)H quinone oxidoreductase
MRVIEMTGAGGPDVLAMSERAVPVLCADEILIKVAYAGVNKPDALQRAGVYLPPAGASEILGLEAAGEVVAVGAAVSEWQVGDYVCALLPGGGYAEYVTAPAAHALPIPAGMSLREAACLPETVFTVWSNVFMGAGLKAGERILIHGGSSGIGTTAIQLAKACGARVFVTAGSAAKCEACEGLGAERAIQYHEEDFVDVMTHFGGADVILDMVGGDYVDRNFSALAMDGRLVSIAFLQGAKAEVNIARIMMRRLSWTGANLRPKSVAAKSEIAAHVLAHVWPLVESGRVKPVMDREFTLEEAADAHAYLEAGTHIGKIVLRVGGA